MMKKNSHLSSSSSESSSPAFDIDFDTPKGAVMQTQKSEDISNITSLKKPIFRFSCKTIKRSEEQSVLSHVSYLAACLIIAASGAVAGDYRNRRGVIFSAIYSPVESPLWTLDRNELWKKAVEVERRCNSVEAREFIMTIPIGLSLAYSKELVSIFCNEIVAKHGCVVDANLHKDKKLDSAGNVKTFEGTHVHVLLTTRRIDSDGFKEKIRDLDERKSGCLVYWRKRWAELANEFLAKAGSEYRIDHRSKKSRGINEPITKPLGVVQVAKNRRLAEERRNAEITRKNMQ